MASSCRQRPAVSEDATPADTLSVALSDTVAVEYVDLRGQFRIAPSPRLVPPGRREVLRVVAGLTSPERVQVVNLEAVAPAQSRVMSQEDFERWALARLPPAEGSRLSLLVGSDPQHIPSRSDRVTLYGAGWCGVSRRAKEHLDALGVDYLELDVERDVEAAQGLLALAEEIGAPIDRVPVLLVRGRLLVGFDPMRLRNVLGDRM